MYRSAIYVLVGRLTHKQHTFFHISTFSTTTRAHRFDKFAFDITDLLSTDKPTQNLVVAVFDPTEFGHIALGKQRLHPPRHPSSIWYTSNTGIWQTVWLEPVRG